MLDDTIAHTRATNKPQHFAGLSDRTPPFPVADPLFEPRAKRPKSQLSRDSFHKVTGNLERPPTFAEYSQLRHYSDQFNCHALTDRGWYHTNNHNARRITIVNPSLKAIKILKRLNCTVTSIEVARDRQDPDGSLQRIYRKNFIHPRQREFYRYSYEGKTDYTMPPGRKKGFAGYKKRVKGLGKGTMHFEARLKGRALHREGIRSIIDLTTFDFDEFWQRHYQFRIYDRKWLEKYLGVKQARQLWKECNGVVQAMMIKTKNVIVGDKRERAFPRVRPQPTSSGWKLVKVTTGRLASTGNGRLLKTSKGRIRKSQMGRLIINES